MQPSKKKNRKFLSPSGLFIIVRSFFNTVDVTVRSYRVIKLGDILQSAFAMFSLKDASLLAFDQRRRTDKNLPRIYHIDNVPCDTQMRKRLDEVDARKLKPLS